MQTVCKLTFHEPSVTRYGSVRHALFEMVTVDIVRLVF